MATGTILCSFNVGGCFFSIPLDRLSHLQDSLLFKTGSSAPNQPPSPRWFIDRDGCTFKHVHYYLQTGKLATSCISELNILYELTAGLRLSSLLQALEHLQSGKHNLRARSVDLQVTERATLNYWKTRICNTRQPEPIASPVSSVHDVVPLGLVGTPLVDGDEEVLYCFVSMDLVRLYPNLVTPHNLLWLSDSVAIIECDTPLFRFIANYLQTGKILLPEQFADHDGLIQEARSAGMTAFMDALKQLHDDGGVGGASPGVNQQTSPQPLYVMTFDLLVRYQDSALGQLCVDSNLEGSRIHITGNGVVFQHVQNWLGTCRVPLTERGCELQGLCEYLDQQDEAYQTFREAVWEFLLRKRTTGRSFTARPWSASVATFTLYKVVKVYVGTHWYATYLETLLKYPELLSNPRKSGWIVYGESLLVKGDGQMFRHILNFLRCGRLLLPSEFREWPLLCQEIEGFQVPALTGALEDCSDYRAWCTSKEPANDDDSSSSSDDSLFMYAEDEDPFVGFNYDEESMDLSPDGSRDDPEDALISVDDEDDACSSVGPEGTLRDTLLRDTEEAGLLGTENRGPTQLPSAPGSVGQTGHLAGPSVRLTLASTVTTSTDHPASMVQSRTWVTRQPPASLGTGSVSLKPGGSANPFPALLQRLEEQKPVSGGYISAVLQGSVPERPPEGVGDISAPLQRLVQLVETVSQWGLNPEPQGTTSGLQVCGGTSNCDVLRAQASVRLSALTALLARQSLPGGAQGASSPTSALTAAEGSTAKPGGSTQRGEDEVYRSRPALRGAVFPVRGCVLPVRGWVLRVDHPPVLGTEEPGGYFTHSVIYTGSPLHTGYNTHKTQDAKVDQKNVAYVCFGLSYEEMAYARQCHAFLTGVILDSVRLEDSKDCTLKIANLVYFLWTGQATVEVFVAELMRIMCSERQKQREERLLQWVEFTLPYARRYSECMEQLGREHCHTVPVFPEDKSTAPHLTMGVPF